MKHRTSPPDVARVPTEWVAGISKALTYYEPGLRPVLKAGGFLTRASRVVERKRYGRRKARRRFQFSTR